MDYDRTLRKRQDTTTSKADNDALTAQLKTQKEEKVECEKKIQLLEDEKVGLLRDAKQTRADTITRIDDTEDSSDPEPHRSSDTEDSELVREFLERLLHLVGPDFRDGKHFDIDRLIHDVVDIFNRDIPRENKRAFILTVNKHASVSEETLDTSLHYYLYSYLQGGRPRRRASAPEGIEEIHEVADDVFKVPNKPLGITPGTPHSKHTRMPILKLLTDLKMMHACM